MGLVVTRVILTVLFYGVITPISLLGRLCGKRFLDVRIDKARATYWEERPPRQEGVEQYEKQY